VRLYIEESLTFEVLTPEAATGSHMTDFCGLKSRVAGKLWIRGLHRSRAETSTRRGHHVRTVHRGAG
jgi:hypothetical protein